MSCTHSNPPGYAFCSSCGEALAAVRCRCGFVAAAGDVFCGRCGASLLDKAAARSQRVSDSEQRFDLEYLMQQVAQENKYASAAPKVHVTQDDIQKLLAMRRKKP